MSPTVKLARFAAVLAVVFGIGWGIGALVDPVIEEPAPAAPAEHGHG